MVSKREQLTQQSFNQIEIQQTVIERKTASNEVRNAVAFDYNQIIEEAL